jgi:hypothetical protein
MTMLPRRTLLLAGAACFGPGAAWALELSELTRTDATAGVKAALQRGAEVAVSQLGRNDGFLGNPKVRIPLPGWLEQGAQVLRSLGQGQRVDELETAMNRAAEAAVPAAKPLLLNAVKSMTVSDAKGILGGGETSVTDFFAQRTRAPLSEKFLPIVKQSTAKVGLARQANALIDKLGPLGSLGGAQPQNLDQYVTGKALDGLYLMIGEEERQIRQDPIGTGSKILGKVFGAGR